MIQKPKKRVFLAIDLPNERKIKIKEKLKGIEDLPVRFLPEIMWHITILFLGCLNDNEIETLKKITDGELENIRSFNFRIEKFMWAPPQRTPRMLWLSLKDSPEFTNLAFSLLEKKIIKKQKENMFSRFKKSTRPTRPSHSHITIARFHEENWPLIERRIREKNIILPEIGGDFKVTSIQMMESKLSRTGAEYSRIAEFLLNF